MVAADHRYGQGHHFLIVIVAAQSHINPARHLARRLARTAKARVTITTPLSSHRRLFPGSSTTAGEPDDSTEEAPLNPDASGVIAYAPYSDGFDDEDHLATIDADIFMERVRSVGSRTVAALAHNFIADGRPVTCVLYTNILTWAVDIARELSIPSIHYWIQPASVFAVYYHYFQGHPSFAFTAADEKDSSFSMELPGIPPLRMKDLPTIITKPNAYLSAHKEIFEELGKFERPIVLMNTFYELEASAIEGIPEMELITIGPTVDKSSTPAEGVGRRDLFEEDGASGYMEWLDSQEERSVVYVSFGSLARLTARQVEELDSGLKKSGRPYLWVLRKDCRVEGMGLERVLKEGKGKVVEWCLQLRVLDHKAVGCFVTHCGWNSMSEAVTKGVPLVMLPQSIEQATNARLAEAAWGIGVTVEVGEDGVVEAVKLMNSVEVVMGEGERARDIRRKTEEWKEKAKEALGENGLASRNLELFVNSLSNYK